MLTRITPFTLTLLVASGPGCSQVAGGDDEVGEQPATDQDPKNFPGWIPAPSRLAYAPYNSPLPGFANDPKDLEYVAFAPIRLATPDQNLNVWVDANLADPSPKPWVWGVPDVASTPPRDNMGEANPFYEMLTFAGYNDEQIELWSDGFLDLEPMRIPAVEHDYALRSGLVGNFGMWITYSVPSTHPRPPIVWMNLLDLATHPFYAGRYQALGQPCSTARGQDTDLHWGDMVTQSSPEDTFYDSLTQLMYSGPDADCKRGMYYYGWHAVSTHYPLEPAQVGYPTESIQAAQCLDNGGQYEVYNGDLGESGEFLEALGNGAILTAADRNGLVWVNGSEMTKLFQTLLAKAPPPFDQWVVVIDILQTNGFNWLSWAVNAEYRHSMWSHTGVCGYAAQVEIDSACDWWTTLACPKHMLPILPEFSRSQIEAACTEADALGEDFDAQTVDGYCTFPSWQVPPGYAAPAQPPIFGLDFRPVDNGVTGLGIPGGLVLGMAGLKERVQRDVADGSTEGEALLAWADEVAQHVRLTTDVDGLRVEPLTSEGRLLVSAMQLTADDRIVTLGHGDHSIEQPNADQLAAYLTTTFDAMEIATLEVESERGTTRFAYVFPAFGDLYDIDLVTTDDVTGRD